MSDTAARGHKIADLSFPVRSGRRLWPRVSDDMLRKSKATLHSACNNCIFSQPSAGFARRPVSHGHDSPSRSSLGSNRVQDLQRWLAARLFCPIDRGMLGRTTTCASQALFRGYTTAPTRPLGALVFAKMRNSPSCQNHQSLAPAQITTQLVQTLP